jgi:hypothetical protein
VGAGVSVVVASVGLTVGSSVADIRGSCEKGVEVFVGGEHEKRC